MEADSVMISQLLRKQITLFILAFGTINITFKSVGATIFTYT